MSSYPSPTPKSLIRRHARGSVVLHAELARQGHLARAAGVLGQMHYRAARQALERGDIEKSIRLTEAGSKAAMDWVRLVRLPNANGGKSPLGRPLIDITPSVNAEDTAILEDMRRGLRRGPSRTNKAQVEAEPVAQPS